MSQSAVNEPNFIQLRAKYKEYLKENENVRKYKESEFYRSMVDLPNAYRLIYEHYSMEL